jgi:hypothetical protein
MLPSSCVDRAVLGEGYRVDEAPNMRLEFRGVYPADWPELSRETKDQAGWRCVRCRHQFDSLTGAPKPCDVNCDVTRGRVDRSLGRGVLRHDHESPGLNFGVHHLDGDRGNQRWWNLPALCNSCHLFIQARVILERAWLFEHSPWFVPYVCGFYAWYFGGREISRAEAIAEPERWLALGQPWRDESPSPAARAAATEEVTRA